VLARAADRREPPLLCIGPEGGFTPGERDLAERRGATRALLLAPALRIETAAVAAAAVLGQL
jgi:RsmE family RNA methyltransferase